MKAKILVAALLAVGCLTSLSAAAAQQTVGPKVAQLTIKAKLTPSERGDLAYEIVKKWGDQIQSEKKMSIEDWTDRMLSTFVNADAANLQRAARADSFEGMMGALAGQKISAENTDRMLAPINSTKQVRSLSKSTTQVSAASGTKALGSQFADLVYTPLPNGRCRVADSRLLNAGAGVPLPAGGSKNLVIWGTSSYAGNGGTGTVANGDGSTNCGIPTNPAAFATSITVLPTDANGGYFKTYKQGTLFQTGSTIYYQNGGGASGDLIVPSCDNCATEVSINANQTVHYVVDVIGYFMPPVATALDCQLVVGTDTAVVANSTGTNAAFAACPTGYTAVSRNCRTLSFATRVSGWNDSLCNFTNSSAVEATVRADTVCCRVPGR